MAAGYGGQLVALNVMGPSELQLMAAQAQDASTAARFNRDTYDDRRKLTHEQAINAGILNQGAQIDLAHKIQLDALDQSLLASIKPRTAGVAPKPTSELAAATAPAPEIDIPDAVFAPEIRKVMASIDPNDPKARQKWDDAMTSLADTVPQAAQLIGRYGKDDVKGWRTVNGVQTQQAASQSPLATAAGGGGGGSQLAAAAPGGGEGSPLGQAAAAAAPGAAGLPPETGGLFTPEEENNLAQRAILDPEGTKKMKALYAMQAYQRTGDMRVLARYAPDIYKDLVQAQKDLTETQKTALATEYDAMGRSANSVLMMADKARKQGLVPEQVSEIQGAYQQAVIDAAKRGWIQPDVALKEYRDARNGIINWGELAYFAGRAQTVSEGLKSSGQEAANEAQAKTGYQQPSLQLVGTTEDGRGIYKDIHNPNAPEQIGGQRLYPKPSSAQNNFQERFKLGMEIYKNDKIRAAQYANGKTELSAPQIAAAVERSVIAEREDATNRGEPFDEAAARAKYQEIYGQATAAPAPGPSGPPPSAAPAQRAVVGGPGKTVAQRVKEIPPSSVPLTQPAPFPHSQAVTPHGLTMAQVWRAHQYHGSKAKLGEESNPYVPHGEAGYNKIPSGKNMHYIGLDGRVWTKK